MALLYCTKGAPVLISRPAAPLLIPSQPHVSCQTVPHSLLGSSVPLRRTSRLSAAVTTAPPAPAPSVEPELPEGQVDLPLFEEDTARKILTDWGFDLLKREAKDVFKDKRQAHGLLVKPPGYSSGKDVPVVLFCHGFSQPIQNYTGTLQRIASQTGAIVIGPETTLFDSFGAVAGSASGWLGELAAAPPTKLQAAIIIDSLRCIAYLTERGISTAQISLCGHSLGAAVSIVNAAMLKNVVGVAVGAPAVKMMMKSPVNPYVHMGNDIKGQDYADAVKYFTDRFPDEARLHIMGAHDDQVVGQEEVAELFTAARTTVKNGRLKDVTLFLVDGSHIGFEDKVSLELDNPFLQVLFWVINLLVYKAEILKWLVGDYSRQLEAYREMLVGSVLDFNSNGRIPFPTDPSPNGVYNVGGGMTAVKTVEAAREAFGDTITFDPEQPVPEPPEDASITVWGPPTAALVAYAATHGFSAVKALWLAITGIGHQSLQAEGGLLVLAALAAALVYDNGLLAAGRFIGQGPDLAAKSANRFVAHSFLPILSLVAAEQAARAGIAWAGRPSFQAFLFVVLSAEVGLSLVQSKFQLELKPLWSNGVLRYGYKDPNFAQRIPALTSSVFIFAMGCYAAKENPAIWPMVAGPLACSLLSAVSTRSAPMFLTSNLGEVLLLLSLVLSEGVLRH